MTFGRASAAFGVAAICVSSAQATGQVVFPRPTAEPSVVTHLQSAEAIEAEDLAVVSTRDAWQQSAAQQPKPAVPSPQPTRKVGVDERVMPHGFSVVLVLADLTASGAQDDVPPAARRALADMKDFLPYKSYKLLDAAWLLGQGVMSVRLRGADDQEYDLRLVAQPRSGGQVSVQFSLRDTPTYEGTLGDAWEVERAVHADAVAGQQARATEIRSLQRELASLESELRQAREKRDEVKAREVDAKIREIRSALARHPDTTVRPVGPRRVPSASRSIIDTSFAMDVGETVVVGTSRLKGNSRALIALLTAVPPNRSRLPDSR